MFSLDGCASTFDSVYLCGLDLSQFQVAWLLDGESIGDTIQLSDLMTGPGTAFPDTGDYPIILSISWRGDPAVFDTDPGTVIVGSSQPPPTSIPEPAAILLFGVGLAGAIGISWRRRRCHRIRGPDPPWLNRRPDR